MARARKGKANSGNNRAAVEKPYVDRYVELFRAQADLREDIKQVGIEAKEADLNNVGAMKEAARRILESEEARNARIDKETECERILRALGAFADEPLGQAAYARAYARDNDESEPFDPLGDPPDAA